MKLLSLKFFLLLLMLISPMAFSSDENIADSEAWVEESNGDWEDGWGDDWGDEENSPWQFSGFIEGAYGTFIKANIVSSDHSLGELRSRFELNYSHRVFEINMKTDVLYDEVLSTTLWQARELNVSASPLINLDLKIGRQVLTWGTGDYLFLNDLFTKNWQAFFSGLEDEYLKSSSDSLRLSAYFGDLTLELVWTPEFTPDNYLSGERFSFYSPQQKKIVAPADNFVVQQRSDEQWAARLTTAVNGVEYALYAYQGYWTTPQGINSQGHGYFPELKTWGGSVRLPFAKGLFNSEFSYYQSSEDRRGNKADIANDQLRFLLGYERELAKNFTLSGQYYLEKTLDYSAFINASVSPKELVAENRHLLTLRLRYTAMQQKLTYSLFAFYSPSDSDSYLRPSLAYRANDSWSYALGGNFFSGKHQYSFFGQHEDNSNIWFRLRYQY